MHSSAKVSNLFLSDDKFTVLLRQLNRLGDKTPSKELIEEVLTSLYNVVEVVESEDSEWSLQKKAEKARFLKDIIAEIKALQDFKQVRSQFDAKVAKELILDDLRAEAYSIREAARETDVLSAPITDGLQHAADLLERYVNDSKVKIVKKDYETIEQALLRWSEHATTNIIIRKPTDDVITYQYKLSILTDALEVELAERDCCFLGLRLIRKGLQGIVGTLTLGSVGVASWAMATDLQAKSGAGQDTADISAGVLEFAPFFLSLMSAVLYMRKTGSAFRGLEALADYKSRTHDMDRKQPTRAPRLKLTALGLFFLSALLGASIAILDELSKKESPNSQAHFDYSLGAGVCFILLLVAAPWLGVSTFMACTVKSAPTVMGYRQGVREPLLPASSEAIEMEGIDYVQKLEKFFSYDVSDKQNELAVVHSGAGTDGLSDALIFGEAEAAATTLFAKDHVQERTFNV